MKKTTKIILTIGLGLVAATGIATGIYFLTRKKGGLQNKMFNETNTNQNNQSNTNQTTQPTLPVPPAKKDFSKLKNYAIIYPSPDGFRWQNIDMHWETANNYVNSGGWYRDLHSVSAIDSGTRNLYHLDFCKGKNTCSTGRVQDRYRDFLSNLRNNGITVEVLNNDSEYQEYSKGIISKI